jgi:hypothetical protein
MKPRVTVHLDYITCIDTEDVTGADTIFIRGAAVGGGEVKPIVVPPIWINNGETKPIRHGPIFDAPILSTERIFVGGKIYDEDAAKDWSVQNINSDVAAILGTGAAILAAIPATSAPTLIAAIIFSVPALLVDADKDDVLGNLELEIPASGPAHESKTYKLSGNRHGWWSNWSYEIGYSIRRIQPQLTVWMDPNTFNANTPVTSTVFATDTDTRIPVSGDVFVGTDKIGTVGTPFTYTFSRSSSAFVRVPGGTYPDVIVPFKLQFLPLTVTVEGPTLIPISRPVQLTVKAVDARTNAPVDGEVQIRSPQGGISKYRTNSTFTHTFEVRRRRRVWGAGHARRRPPDDVDDGGEDVGNGENGEDGEVVVDFPSGIVIAEAYEKKSIPFEFSDPQAEAGGHR